MPMELPQGNEWIIWIFKFMCLGGIIYLSRKFSDELREASAFFKFEIFVVVAILLTIVGTVVTMIVFYEKNPFVVEIIHIFIKSLFWIFFVLIVGRVIYKKFYPTETSK